MTSVQKRQFFSAGSETNRIRKKSFILQFLEGVGVSRQIFILGPYEIAKLQIFSGSYLNVILEFVLIPSIKGPFSYQYYNGRYR